MPAHRPLSPLMTPRAALTALLLAASASAAESVPLAIGEGQAAPLLFERKVGQVAVSDSGVIAARSSGNRVEVVGLQGGSARLTVELEGGSKVAYDVKVAAASRPAPCAGSR